jgi:hypothetical protein
LRGLPREGLGQDHGLLKVELVVLLVHVLHLLLLAADLRFESRNLLNSKIRVRKHTSSLSERFSEARPSTWTFIVSNSPCFFNRHLRALFLFC